MIKLSIVIPAYNEESTIADTVNNLFTVLSQNSVEHEIIVINDNSTDNTLSKLNQIKPDVPTLAVYTSTKPNGFGYAVREGLEKFSGDYVAIMMADLSDSPEDLVKFFDEIASEKVDCVFGSRFAKGGSVHDYPKFKLFLNRLFNLGVRVTFGLKYNDITNAFKMYSRETIEGLKPFLSPHFNLTLELPLKAIVRGYTYTIIPNSWRNRSDSESKLKIKEMGSRYFFIYLYCLIEKFFSKGDYKK